MGRSVPKSPRLPDTSATGFARKCRIFHCAIDLNVGKASCFCSVAAAASPSAWSAMAPGAKARDSAPADQFDCGGQAHVPRPVETEIAHRPYRRQQFRGSYLQRTICASVPLRAQPSLPKATCCVAAFAIRPVSPLRYIPRLHLLPRASPHSL
jgi:hypothetical protein